MLKFAAPVAGIIARETSAKRAVAMARAHGAHVHQQESETGPGWVYYVCDCGLTASEKRTKSTQA